VARFALPPFVSKVRTPRTTADDAKSLVPADDLAAALAEHDKWLDSNAREGDRLNLENRSLRGVKFPANADLREANLRDADLRYADLTGANLQKADLTDAKLWDATLRNADQHRRLTTQAQRRRPRGAPIATATRCRRSLQRMVRPHGHDVSPSSGTRGASKSTANHQSA